MELKLNLSPQFLEEIKKYLSEEAYTSFLHSFSQSSRPALRMNTLKFSKESFLDFFHHRYPQVFLTPIPWTEDGFFYEDQGEIPSFFPGREPAYLAGFYYLQEASAMLPAQVLKLQKGLILDMCAAPGGKSTKLASLSEDVTLYSNDLSKDRAMILLRNLEQYGLQNAFVLQEDALNFSVPFEEQVDVILLDAPCSGEGMFRRDARARQSYEKYQVHKIAEIQAFLLDCAVKMLKVGGEMLYSTCTFNLHENEVQIYHLLQKYPQLELLSGKERIRVPSSVSEGVASELLSQTVGAETEEEKQFCEKISKASLRLWPHIQEADGHYAILLRKNASTLSAREEVEEEVKVSKKKNVKAKKEKTEAVFTSEHSFVNFAKENLKPAFLKKVLEQQERLHIERDYLHYLPAQEKSLHLEKLHVLKRGVLLGQEKVFGAHKRKFTPSHSFALAYGQEAFLYTYELKEDEDLLTRYIQGQSLNVEEAQEALWREQAIKYLGKEAKVNYVLLTYYGHPFGLVKKEAKILKNLYPKSWVR